MDGRPAGNEAAPEEEEEEAAGESGMGHMGRLLHCRHAREGRRVDRDEEGILLVSCTSTP